MHLHDRDAGDFGPSLVGVSVVVQELVTQHQGDREQTVFAAKLASDSRIELLQSIDEEQAQQYDVLCNLGSREYRGHPLTESGRGHGLWGQRLWLSDCRRWIFRNLEHCSTLEPEHAGDLRSQFCKATLAAVYCPWDLE